MKYIEEYLKDIIKVKPLGELTTKEDELDGMSGEMVYIDGKCSNIFISHSDYANWLENQTLEKQPLEPVDIDIESMVNSYKQRLIIQGSIENSPIVNMCLTAFRQGVENVLEELDLK